MKGQTERGWCGGCDRGARLRVGHHGGACSTRAPLLAQSRSSMARDGQVPASPHGRVVEERPSGVGWGAPPSTTFPWCDDRREVGCESIESLGRLREYNYKGGSTRGKRRARRRLRGGRRQQAEFGQAGSCGGALRWHILPTGECLPRVFSDEKGCVVETQVGVY